MKRDVRPRISGHANGASRRGDPRAGRAVASPGGVEGERLDGSTSERAPADDSRAPTWWSLGSSDDHGVDVASWTDTGG
ncbi:hypothetical protein [Cellulosimicrobium sp. NPDC055967]|uniref:hypothetical protein n=1 Tax=Cellulosimicrobium sp. NPDC055967 TaxID=3345670 RepID=UPI0035D88F08